MSASLTIVLPDWIEGVVRAQGERFADDEARMGLAIALAAENVARGGGPFGAAVFAADRCVAAGVNRVLDARQSIAHAEIVAIMGAQQALAETYAAHTLTLVTSAEPCCQCFGAIVWSGVARLVCGANTSDVEAIGFDEGPKPEAWQAALRARGIEVIEDVARAAARSVLDDYRKRGGVIYGKPALR